MMVKIKALITLVVGKKQEVVAGKTCDVSEEDAKRLFKLGFAEILSKQQKPPKPPVTQYQEEAPPPENEEEEEPEEDGTGEETGD